MTQDIEQLQALTKKHLPRGSVKFPCPKCGKSEIVRSRKEREIVIKYTCSSCGFEGPN